MSLEGECVNRRYLTPTRHGGKLKEELMIQTYTPVRGMITCIDGGEFVKTSDHLFEIAKKDKEIEELKEKIQEIEARQKKEER